MAAPYPSPAQQRLPPQRHRGAQSPDEELNISTPNSLSTSARNTPSPRASSRSQHISSQPSSRRGSAGVPVKSPAVASPANVRPGSGPGSRVASPPPAPRPDSSLLSATPSPATLQNRTAMRWAAFERQMAAFRDGAIAYAERPVPALPEPILTAAMELQQEPPPAEQPASPSHQPSQLPASSSTPHMVSGASSPTREDVNNLERVSRPASRLSVNPPSFLCATPPPVPHTLAPPPSRELAESVGGVSPKLKWSSSSTPLPNLPLFPISLPITPPRASSQPHLHDVSPFQKQSPDVARMEELEREMREVKEEPKARGDEDAPEREGWLDSPTGIPPSPRPLTPRSELGKAERNADGVVNDVSGVGDSRVQRSVEQTVRLKQHKTAWGGGRVEPSSAPPPPANGEKGRGVWSGEGASGYALFRRLVQEAEGEGRRVRGLFVTRAWGTVARVVWATYQSLVELINALVTQWPELIGFVVDRPNPRPPPADELQDAWRIPCVNEVGSCVRLLHWCIANTFTDVEDLALGVNRARFRCDPTFTFGVAPHTGVHAPPQQARRSTSKTTQQKLDHTNHTKPRSGSSGREERNRIDRGARGGGEHVMESGVHRGRGTSPSPRRLHTSQSPAARRDAYARELSGWQRSRSADSSALYRPLRKLSGGAAQPYSVAEPVSPRVSRSGRERVHERGGDAKPSPHHRRQSTERHYAPQRTRSRERVTQQHHQQPKHHHNNGNHIDTRSSTPMSAYEGAAYAENMDLMPPGNPQSRRNAQSFGRPRQSPRRRRVGDVPIISSSPPRLGLPLPTLQSCNRGQAVLAWCEQQQRRVHAQQMVDGVTFVMPNSALVQHMGLRCDEGVQVAFSQSEPSDTMSSAADTPSVRSEVEFSSSAPPTPLQPPNLPPRQQHADSLPVFVPFAQPHYEAMHNQEEFQQLSTHPATAYHQPRMQTANTAMYGDRGIHERLMVDGHSHEHHHPGPTVSTRGQERAPSAATSSYTATVTSTGERSDLAAGEIPNLESMQRRRSNSTGGGRSRHSPNDGTPKASLSPRVHWSGFEGGKERARGERRRENRVSSGSGVVRGVVSTPDGVYGFLPRSLILQLDRSKE